MRKLLLGAALALVALPAFAASNLNVTEGTGKVLGCIDNSGICYTEHILVDRNGVPITTLNVAGGVTQNGVWTFQPGNTANLAPWLVSVVNGITQSGTWNVNQAGTWTFQLGNTPNTVPILATINQGGNSAIVAAGGSPYGAALAVAGGITPATAISTGPLSSPILAAVSTPGGTSYVPGQLNIPVMTTPGRLQVDYSGIAVSSTVASGTTGVANTFQTVLAASATRQGCLIQNNGAGNAFIYVGSLSAATTPKSFQIVPQGTFNCNSGGSILLSDTINIAAVVSSAFVAVSQ